MNIKRFDSSSCVWSFMIVIRTIIVYWNIHVTLIGSSISSYLWVSSTSIPLLFLLITFFFQFLFLLFLFFFFIIIVIFIILVFIVVLMLLFVVDILAIITPFLGLVLSTTIPSILCSIYLIISFWNIIFHSFLMLHFSILDDLSLIIWLTSVLSLSIVHIIIDVSSISWEGLNFFFFFIIIILVLMLLLKEFKVSCSNRIPLTSHIPSSVFPFF
jgi:hypothetical protein